MDLIGAYSDSDAEDASGAGPSKMAGPSMPTEPLTASSAPALRNAAPDPDAQRDMQPAGLFNPFAEGQASPSTASPSGSGAPKRDFTQVTGSGPLQPGPAKASRTAAAPGGPKPAFGAGMLVPPQLRNGRANVSTEDVEKLFSKGALARRPAPREPPPKGS